jgi:hypothetical protein
MDRRTFVAAGVSAVGVVAAGVGEVLFQPGIRGERVRLSGWMAPSGKGAGHFFLFKPEGEGEAAMVLPSDSRAMRAGRVTVEGRLYRGRFRDETTGHRAGAVLLEASLV